MNLSRKIHTYESNIVIFDVLVLQRNTPAPLNVPGFPEWSVPVSMNCTCMQPCSFIGYTTEIRKYAK